MKHLSLLAASALSLVAITAPASAATVVFNGTTVGKPVFNRPFSTISLTLVGTAVNFDPVGFTVDTAGSYTLTTATGQDAFLALYQGAFDPASPLANILAVDDDAGPGSDSQISFSLATGFNYIGVVTAYANGDSFPYTLTITGPGTTSAIGAAVPEPVTWAMMIVGIGAVGGAMRRRNKAATTVKFA